MVQAGWWVDASFGIHDDMKSHTGVIMSLEKGAYMLLQEDKGSILGAQLKLNWWVLMTCCHRSSGHGISWIHKAILYILPSFTKII